MMSMSMKNRLISLLAACWLTFAPAAYAANQASVQTPTSGPMTAAQLTATYLNPALLALFTCNWGPSAPANGPGAAPSAYQCWANTTTNPVVFNRYDGASWVAFGNLDTTAHTWTPVGSPAFSGGTLDALTRLGIRSTGAAFDVDFASSEVLTATRTLSWVLGDANRSITLNGNVSIGGAFTLSGAFGFTGTLTGTTSVTFPTVGTLATLAGTETLTNKTFVCANQTSCVVRLGSDVTGTLAAAQFPAQTGDVTNTAGSLANAITALAVHSSMLNADVYSTAHSWGAPQTFVNPIVGTQSPGDNSTKGASTAYADAIAALKANIASPAFTGIPTAPTAAPGTNTTQLANTAFVQAAISGSCNTLGAFLVGTGSASQCSTVAGSTAVLAGSLSDTVTNPSINSPPVFGFEPLTNFFGIASTVTVTSAGSSSGTVGLLGQIENQKGGVTAGVEGTAKDSIGSENYALLGSYEINHASSTGASGGFYIRPNATNSIAPNPLLYSGNNGVNIVNENVLATTGVANAAIGLYINGLCNPSSSISGTCPAGGSSDNTFLIGLNVASARDEGIRIGSASSNGYIPTKPIAVYATNNSLLWNLDNTGNTHSVGYYLGSVLFAKVSGNYNIIYEPIGFAALSLGNTTDPSNYYDNTNHVFRTRNAGAVVGTLTSTGFAGLASVGIRDTSAAFDVSLAATSSVALTAGRTLTVDVVNAARTLKLGSNLTLASDPGAVTGALKSDGAGTFAQAAAGDLSGLGTGVATALGVNVGTAGSVIVNGGALGSPSSAGTLPAFTLGGAISGGGNNITNIGLVGIGGSFTPTNPLSFTGQSAQIMWMERETTASTNGNNLTIQAGGATSGMTNGLGGNLILAAGIATGTAGGSGQSVGSVIIAAPSDSGGSGTADVLPTEFARFTNFGGNGGLCFIGASCNVSTYSFLGGSGFSVFNVATGGFIGFRVNNADKMRMGANGGFSVGTTTDPGAGAILANTSILSQGATAGIGYATGAGVAGTQATSKNTTVTNFTKMTGTITMNGAALAAGAIVTFSITGAANSATDYIGAVHESVGTTGAYTINCRATGAGTASCDVRNNTAGSLSEAIVLRMWIGKSVNSFLMNPDIDGPANDNIPAYLIRKVA